MPCCGPCESVETERSAPPAPADGGLASQNSGLPSPTGGQMGSRRSSATATNLQAQSDVHRRLADDIQQKRGEIQALSSLLQDSRDAEAKAAVLRQKAAEMQVGRARDVVLAQSAAAATAAQVRRAEESAARRREELAREQADMRALLARPRTASTWWWKIIG